MTDVKRSDNRTSLHTAVLGRVLVAGLLVLGLAACSGEPPPDVESEESVGDELMRRMSDTLAGASAFRFTTNESLEPLETALVQEVMHFSRTVTVQRPDSMFFELHGSEDAPVHVSASYDGSSVSLHDQIHGVWAQTEVPGTLDEMLDDVAIRFSVPVPIADVIYSAPYEALVGPNSEGGFVGEETLDGVECARFGYHDEVVAVHVWIPVGGQPLPRRLELVYKQAPGAPRARVDFTSWDLEPEIAQGTFAHEPAEGATGVAFEEFVARLLSDGIDLAAEAEAAGPVAE